MKLNKYSMHDYATIRCSTIVDLPYCPEPIVEETLTSGEYVSLFLISILNMNI